MKKLDEDMLNQPDQKQSPWGNVSTAGNPSQIINGGVTNPVWTTGVDGVQGVKYDAGKPRMSLIPASALIEEAKVMTYGAQKYAPHNWRKGMPYTRVLDAALRHINAFNGGEDKDPETGLSHLAHARCCLAFLIEYQESGIGEDDRYGR